MFYSWLQLFTLRVRQDWPERISSACSYSYRTELQRQRDFYCGFLFWSRISMVVCGFALFCLGGLAVHPENIRGYAILAVFLLSALYFAVCLNSRETRKYQHQIQKAVKLASQVSNIN